MGRSTEPNVDVHLTASLDAAIWGAELAVGEGRGRIYRVEPTGPLEDDPNLTDQRFPGYPTRSYRTREPLRVVGEIVDWESYSLELLQGTAGPPRRAQAASTASRPLTTEHPRLRAST